MQSQWVYLTYQAKFLSRNPSLYFIIDCATIKAKVPKFKYHTSLWPLQS